MKKRLLALLLCFTMAICLMPTVAFAAAEFTVDGLKYEVLTEGTGGEAGTAILTGNYGNPTAISVETVENGGKSYKVTEVGDVAFFNCDSLVSIDLPEATTIGYRAVYECSSLKSASMPKATTIGGYAFYNCDSLTSIDLPEATTIGYCAFYNCDSLTSIDLPEATTIGAGAFDSCSALASIDLPEATTINSNAFYNCTSLESVTVMQTTAPSLGSDAFNGVPSNCTLYIPLNATGYTTTNGWPSNQVSMWPVRGTVYDEDGNPAANITVSAGGYSFTTDTDGSYAAYVKPEFTGDITATLNGESKSISLYDVSAELSGKDIFFGTVATPTFEPAEGTFTGTQSVTIDCGTPGATIRYTTDGSEPTATSDEYTGAISVTDTTTIKTKAFKAGLADSETAEISYTLGFSITLPSGTGYTAAAEGTSTSPTAKGGNYSFTLTIDSNYEKGASFAVKVNGAVLTPVGDVYTIENITSAQTVTVEGIVMKNADYTAVDTAIASIPTDLTLYTEETAKAVNDAKNAVVIGKKIDEQATVDGYAANIEQAVIALQYKDAVYDNVNAAIAKIPADLTSYTDETVNVLKDARNAVISGKNITEQATVDGYATAIENAINGLEYKDADYSAVDTAIASIPGDLSDYTEETVKAVNDAKNAVITGKNITEQDIVDGYASAIDKAINALTYKAADYSKVDAAIAKIPADLSVYTAETAKAVTDAKDAVIRGKNITEQETVNGYASAINNAVSSLEKKKVEPESPQTGDNSNMALWIALLFISGSAVTVLGISQKRKKAK